MTSTKNKNKQTENTKNMKALLHHPSKNTFYFVTGLPDLNLGEYLPKGKVERKREGGKEGKSKKKPKKTKTEKLSPHVSGLLKSSIFLICKSKIYCKNTA